MRLGTLYAPVGGCNRPYKPYVTGQADMVAMHYPGTAEAKPSLQESKQRPKSNKQEEKKTFVLIFIDFSVEIGNSAILSMGSIAKRASGKFHSFFLPDMLKRTNEQQAVCGQPRLQSH
jgi:hypothetical protein